MQSNKKRRARNRLRDKVAIYRLVRKKTPAWTTAQQIVLCDYFNTLYESSDPGEVMEQVYLTSRQPKGFSSQYDVCKSDKNETGVQKAFRLWVERNPALTEEKLKEQMSKDEVFLEQYEGEPADTLWQRYRDYLITERSDGFLLWVDDKLNAVVDVNWAKV